MNIKRAVIGFALAVSYTVGGVTYLVMANEGDTRIIPASTKKSALARAAMYSTRRFSPLQPRLS